VTPYAELAVTTNFSFLRGASHPEELAFTAAELGLAGVAVADRNSLAGVVRGHLAAKEAGLAYVVGCRLVFRDRTPDIFAWPKDRPAYGRLCRLLTVGNRRAEKGHCHLDLGDLLAWGEGMILGVCAGTSADGGDGGLAWPDEDGALAATLARLTEAFPDAVRLMANLAYGPWDHRRLAILQRIAKRAGVALMATNMPLYHRPSRRMLQDVVTCIREHVTLQEAGRRLAANAERHLKPPDEMARIFRGYREAIAETVAVLGQLSFSLEELRYEYPDEPTGEDATPQAALERLTAEGVARRYPAGVPDKVQRVIEHELKLIDQLNYAPYFLTVEDIMRFARSRGILAQGRGSAANSAVCFALGITEVDPERADLLFERFISAERNEPPDIDVDFEHERREEVMQYIYEKYGRERAGLAATVITYRSRSAVREIGKAFGLSEDAVGALSGAIWGWSKEGVKEEDVRRIGLDPAQRTMMQVMTLSQEIAGFPRHLSQHVGGFVITRDRLDEVCPIMNAAMEDRTTVEWDKDDLDALGILKIDILALGMLSCIRRAFDFMEQHYGGAPTLATIPAEDPAVYRMLHRADSLGVFQVESRAQMSMLPRLKPACFYDLVIEVAIVRPGPIQGDMVHPYLRRRDGLEEVIYPAPAPEHGPPDELERVLGKTLGVPLFQEQAMKIAIVAAGFSPGEADKLRRAMATFRRVGTIGTFQRKMVEGMTARGYESDFAERCFRQIEGFGEYGFPESHAASFALLVYASCWLKCHYPDAFCAALLNAQPMGFYAPAQIVRDAERHGVRVLPPDINRSGWDASLETADNDPPPLHPSHAEMRDDIRSVYAVRLGLRQAKGFREDDARKLMAMRDRGYDSVRDLWLRSGLGRGAIERLADADAFRSVGLDRRDALWAARGLGVKGKTATTDRLPLFDTPGNADIRREPDVDLPPMPIGEHVVNDYRYLSLSLKTHPLALLREELTARRIVTNATLGTTPSGRRVSIAGLVIIRQRPGTAKGVIFETLEDETDIANVIVWPKVFEKYRPIVIGARLVRVTGKVQSASDVIHVVADRLEDLTPLLGMLAIDTEGLEAHARADEVKRPQADMREKIGPRTRLVQLAKEEPGVARDLARMAGAAGKVMPRGRNFH